MNFMSLLYALPADKIHALAWGAGLLALVLFAFSVRLLFFRRKRARPLALVVADAIAVGSVHDVSSAPASQESARESVAPSPQRQGSVHLVLSRYEQRDDGLWAFSLSQGGNVIATFVYPGVDEARGAHKAMRRALRDMTYALQPEAQRHSQAEADIPADDFRPQRVWA